MVWIPRDGQGMMTVMASLQTLERRILALEARLADVEGGYGDTLYKLHRASVKANLRTAKLLQHFEIEDVSANTCVANRDLPRATTIRSSRRLLSHIRPIFGDYYGDPEYEGPTLREHLGIERPAAAH